MNKSNIQKKTMKNKIEQMIKHFRAIKQMIETIE
jgi:DNA-binding FrmR family transcriptional regulator